MGRTSNANSKMTVFSYEENKLRAHSNETDVRVEVALASETEPEILYYLADDTDLNVRRSLAQNPATPVQANALLAKDEEDEVRQDLARKICKILPDLSGQDAAALQEKTIEVLEMLAEDQATTVRAIVSEALKDTMEAPRHIVLALARDLEEIVAGPILEYSPLLSDDDLIEIIASGVAVEALPAIARREAIGEDVSAAVAASLEIPAVAALLANPSAKVREETLDEIIDQAETVADLHEPLAMRLDLSLRAVRRIAGFVGASLVEKLARKRNLSPDVEADLKQIVRSRIDKAEEISALQEPGSALTAEALWATGTLDEERLTDAIKEKDHSFVATSLSLMTGFSQEKIQTMMEARNGKIVTSLCWKAGLSMRLAFKIQTKIAHVPRQEIVNARNGIEFPFTEEEMNWQLSFYTED
ncbi:DUF2336 domain-containing protein [Sneathiella marina]|uniref:DUF2336 domain-containing protein n=1 Tax=Sneathiella marina TaxID=2950108 RepID=A0ABY4W4J8_9PROT|nr:DUF2336 domain-containing protein [Sneathiella marina]USG61756.1 DUF2336 domain-containing protein [Sneathiella marina]